MGGSITFGREFFQNQYLLIFRARISRIYSSDDRGNNVRHLLYYYIHKY